MVDLLDDESGTFEASSDERRTDERRLANRRTKNESRLAMPAIVLNTVFILLLQALVLFIFCH